MTYTPGFKCSRAHHRYVMGATVVTMGGTITRPGSPVYNKGAETSRGDSLITNKNNIFVFKLVSLSGCSPRRDILVSCAKGSHPSKNRDRKDNIQFVLSLSQEKRKSARPSLRPSHLVIYPENNTTWPS